VGPNPVDEHTFTTASGPVYYRSAPAAGTRALYLHGIPTSSDDWVPFLERTGGIALDLIGFGRSSKGGHLDYSLDGLVKFVEELLDQLDVGRVGLVGHQWGGAVAVMVAVRNPERVERLVLLNPLPLIEGFRWPRIARWWRRPVLGELLMGSTGRRLLARELRRGTASPDAWSREALSTAWEQFDQGTQRAILRLHRGTPEAALDQVVGDLRAPVTVHWGERDPWLPAGLGERFSARLPGAEFARVDGGHWPWLDQPELIELVAAQLVR
jgi:pimeloyl-ACP methyl ester carboxylesterase